jgi:hypothetical protein
MRTRQDYIKENLTYFQDLIIKNENFSVIKVGDGEIDCMQNKEGINIDLHPYSKELGEKLVSAFTELVKKGVYINDWFYSNPPINSRDEQNLNWYSNFTGLHSADDNFVKFIRPFELLMLGWGNVELPYLFDFYETIKKSNRNKIYVGPDRLSGLQSLLNIDHYTVIPLINAFSSYDVILRDINDMIVDDSIIMLSVGLQSPAIANELLNFNSNITILDIGSGFDPLYFAQTRGRAQASVEEAKKYFEKL